MLVLLQAKTPKILQDFLLAPWATVVCIVCVLHDFEEEEELRMTLDNRTPDPHLIRLGPAVFAQLAMLGLVQMRLVDLDLDLCWCEQPVM